MATTKPAKASAKKITKTAFVLGLPRDMSASDVVKKAEASGMLLTEKYVYVIRSSHRGGSKKRGPGRPAKSARRGRRPAKRATQNRSADGLEQRLRSNIAQLGLDRARQILDEVAAAFAG
jgi:hypothetical protein